MFETDTDTEAVVHLITDEMQTGLGRRSKRCRRRSEAAARRVRARHHLRRSRRSDDRRAPGLAARHRSWHGRDVSRLATPSRSRRSPTPSPISMKATGPYCTAPASRSSTAAASASSARWSSRSPVRCSSTRAITATSWPRKSTSSRKSSATRSPTTSTWRPARVHFPDLGIDLAKVARVTISACGTAYYAGLVAKYWIERYARVPVEIDVASELRYREAPLPEGGLAVFVSQSGETADTLATLRYCKANGQRIASVVNVRTSTIAREVRRRAADARRARNRRRLHQGLHLPAVGARLPRDRPRPRARHDQRARRKRELVKALIEVPRHISIHAPQRAAVRGHRSGAVEGARRALSRPRHELSRWPSRAR